MNLKISILICSLKEREVSLFNLLVNVFNQCGLLNNTEVESFGEFKATRYIFDEVEVIVAVDNRNVSTGNKRNILYEMAKGKYSVSVDDDDQLPDYYVKELIYAAYNDVDCFAINGLITTNGENSKDWFISKDLPYETSKDDIGNIIYLRYPNHITPIRTTIAQQFKFPDIVYGEDFNWATQIHNSGLIKTEYKINKPMYFYNYNNLK